MHPVIEHLLARKNKKVPIKDGRKIALVLFGGTMTGIRGAGAGLALEELGLRNAFDEIYSVSAGFANASYLLSENGKIGTSIYYENLQHRDFINFRRLWKIVDIDHVIGAMKEIKPLNIGKIYQSKTKLYVGLFNAKKKSPDMVETHKLKPKLYFKLMKAALSIPYLNPGAVTVGYKKYKDYPFDDIDYINVILRAIDEGATDLLVIYNYYSQISLQKKFPKHVLEISPRKNWELSHFETNPAKLIKACKQMGNYIKRVFGSKKPIKLYFSENKK